MKAKDKLGLAIHALKWRMTWGKKDLDYLPSGIAGPRFITAREAAKLIPDNAVVFSSGLAGNARCSAFYYAIKERYIYEGKPRDLTWIHCGAQGGRGKVPGTIEELAEPGLLKRLVSGHVQTELALLALAEKGQLEICILSQGVISLLLEEQAAGRNLLRTTVGVGTFIDPRTGRGSALTPASSCPFVNAEGYELTYTMPKVEWALFSASYADLEGNIYTHHSTILSESLPSAAAARANGGKVMVVVGGIIPKNEKLITLRANEVDHIVIDRFHEQACSIPVRKHWAMFDAGAHVDEKKAVEELKLLNNILKITPVRNKVSHALARLGALVFREVVNKGAMVNVGSGFPEEVARVLVEQGLGKDLLFTTEAGVYGGLPAPGIFFSACINPIRLEPSSVMFRRYQRELDATILGMLQADEAGNENVSMRGRKVSQYGGPGGFPDIVEGARTVIFIGKWMDRAKLTIRGGRMHISSFGIPKLVKHVDEVTFSGRHALDIRKNVYYVTNVGVFHLTRKGMELIMVVPGIDIQKEIIEASPARIIIPDAGPKVIDESVLTGKNFRLEKYPD